MHALSANKHLSLSNEKVENDLKFNDKFLAERAVK